MTQDISQVNIPPVRIKARPGMVANGEKLTVLIESLDHYEESVELTLELVTSDREHVVFKSVASLNATIKITVPQDLPPGDYELRAIYQDLILDGTPIEITSAENAAKAQVFFLGLEHQQAALKAVHDAKYEAAFALGRSAEKQFQLADSPDIAARSWDDIASAFLKEGEYQKAADAFEQSEFLFRKAGDPDSEAESNYWKGIALSNLKQTQLAFSAFKTALSSSESQRLELIALRSCYAITELPITNASKRVYLRKFVGTALKAKSPAGRLEALNICRETDTPIKYTSKLWKKNRKSRTSNKIIHFSGHGIHAHKPNEQTVKPEEWVGRLGEVNAELLSQILSSLWGALAPLPNKEVALKVSTKSSRDEESFSIGTMQTNEEEVQELINLWISDSDDFRYYEDLAKTLDISLNYELGTSEGQPFIQAKVNLAK